MTITAPPEPTIWWDNPVGILPKLAGVVAGTNDITIWNGNALPVLRTMPANSVHSIITDPPYGLSDHTPDQVIAAITAWATGDRERVPDGKGFMGHEWDAFVPPPAIWDECYRVLRPGGHMAVFAGSRTVDLMGLSIRLAGFVMRDTINWLYSSGFPKSRDIGKDMTPGTDTTKEWDGWGTALKPASEPIIVARKPFKGTVAGNVLKHGTGGINIGASKIPAPDAPDIAKQCLNAGSRYTGIMNGGVVSASEPRTTSATSAGRWPANVVLSHAMTPDGFDACENECVDGCAVKTLDEQSGITPSGGNHRPFTRANRGGYAGPMPEHSDYSDTRDSGGASRFYNVFRYQAKAPQSERPKVNGKGFATVKPLSLIEWLVTLYTPPGGTVLDNNAGTGTTGQAAYRRGCNCILIERERDHIPYIKQRLALPNLAVGV